jgi:hypothetical protein
MDWEGVAVLLSRELGETAPGVVLRPQAASAEAVTTRAKILMGRIGYRV